MPDIYPTIRHRFEDEEIYFNVNDLKKVLAIFGERVFVNAEGYVQKELVAPRIAQVINEGVVPLINMLEDSYREAEARERLIEDIVYEIVFRD